MVAAGLATSVLPVDAQVNGTSIGAKVGVSWSSFNIEPDSADQSRLSSLTGGAFIRFDLGYVGLQPELMIVTKGSRTDTGIEDVEGSIKLDYLEIPLLLYVPLLQGGAVPYLLAGPAVAFELACEAEVEFGAVEISAGCDDEDDNAAELVDHDKVDFGLIAGLGLTVPTGPGAALIEARYTFGLRKILEGPAFSARNRSLALLVGYSLPIDF